MLVQSLVKSMGTILVVGGGLLATGCGGATPSVIIDVKLPPGPEQRYTIAEMQARAEMVAVSLGFVPAPEFKTIGKLYTWLDGGGVLVLAVYQLPQNQEVNLMISRHTVPELGPMLGVSISEPDTGGSYFKDQSIAKMKLLELFRALREEFGTDRIYLNDWAQEQIQ